MGVRTPGASQRTGVVVGLGFCDAAWSLELGGRTAKCSWSVVRGLRRVGNLFLLETEPGTDFKTETSQRLFTLVIPRRVFVSTDEIARFNDLVDRHAKTGR
jgi:hypothetical protein